MTTPNKDPVTLPGSLWCISAYFNPLGLQSRYENFLMFYQRMTQHNANMLFAELSLHDRGFELDKIVSPDQLPVMVVNNIIMWQKEALLNLLLDHLPDDCDKVCWIDTDVLYHNDDWQQEICDMLEKYRMVQGYSFAANLPKGVEFVDNIDMNSFPIRWDDCSRFYSYLCGALNNQIKQGNGHPGFCWAVRREVLEKCRFYPECVMGGGDYLMARAATFSQYSPEVVERYSRWHLDSYFRWARNWTAAIDFSVAYIPNTLYHLYHGSMNNRQHENRLNLMKNMDYDPYNDITMTGKGVYQLTQTGARFVKPVHEFFSKRYEDG